MQIYIRKHKESPINDLTHIMKCFIAFHQLSAFWRSCVLDCAQTKISAWITLYVLTAQQSFMVVITEMYIR